MKPTISLLITDLDNTLYDWVGSFVPSFYAMIDDAVTRWSIPREVLLDDLRAVHQRHGSSEHPFALSEARCIRDHFAELSEDEVRQELDPAFYAFNKARKAHLQLYPGVHETLKAIEAEGVPIVAYTDARAVNGADRIEKLGLRPFIKRLYAPAQRLSSADHECDYVTVLPSEDRKPNPKTLRDICDRLDVDPRFSLYLGDSLVRDVFMAKCAGVVSAWARYGTAVDPNLWARLVRVTHWTEADVEREKEIREDAGLDSEPDLTLEGISDLLGMVKFKPAF
ncbi:HAD family hydrolase [Mycobacterium sp. 1245852.3]|uniref:HAD family hydrolase n=1 Tax=Mycobacterium sp. 1245852.3 TaxID=1856860 RepID=UPI0009EF46C9|nr:HAD family hydrolase [Mycobacterium sp. 1245852.3]